jgi:proteasome lid subunit RPN8/RPN11
MLQAMIDQARAELPNECCGLLAGKMENGVGKAIHRYPLVNATASPTEYCSEPRSLLAAYKDMRDRGLHIIGVYHSHPTSPPVPSRLDQERNFYEEIVHLIISLAVEPPEVRGWWLGRDRCQEADWKCHEENV